VTEGRERAPDHQRGQGPPWDVPSVHRRPDYPLVGCAPAEPTSVSPAGGEYRERSERARATGQHVVRLTKTGPGSSEGSPFFGLDNGVHLTGQLGDLALIVCRFNPKLIPHVV